MTRVVHPNSPTAEKLSAEKSLSWQPRLGVILPNWVGDACMATPTLRAIRNAYSTAHIVGVMQPVVRDVLAGAWGNSAPWLNETLIFRKRRKQKQDLTRWQLIKELHQRSLDAIVLLTNSFWSASVAYLAGVRTIVGYDRDYRGWMLSDKVPVPTENKIPKPISAIDYYLELAKSIGCEANDRRMALGLDPTDEQLCEDLWRELGLSPTRKSVVINSNAANASARIWPAHKVEELARQLTKDDSLQVILHCGPQERNSANDVAAAISHPRVVSMGAVAELPIGLSKAVLSKADVVVSTDSGARHMAVALGKPVVSLFGPTDARWTATYNTPETLVDVALDCRSCYQTSCPLKHHNCMNDITVETVLRSVLQKLGGEQHKPTVYLPTRKAA